VITTSGPSYWHSIAPHLMGFNLGLYIYNDSPYFKIISPYRKLRITLKKKLHFWFFMRDASGYLVQTDDVKERVIKALKNERVYTVSNTHSDFFNDSTNYKVNLPFKRDDEIWFLTLSSYYKHKNMEIIPSVIAELNNRGYKNIKFIVTLDKSTFKNVFGIKNTKDIMNAGPVRPEECPSLYRKCDYTFIPSLAECFSASYPEAMKLKKPIVTTDLPFAHRICDNAAIYYKPMDSKDAANAIELLINDLNLRETLMKNGLQRLKHFDSAKERAKKILDICSEIKCLSGSGSK